MDTANLFLLVLSREMSRLYSLLKPRSNCRPWTNTKRGKPDFPFGLALKSRGWGPAPLNADSRQLMCYPQARQLVQIRIRSGIVGLEAA